MCLEREGDGLVVEVEWARGRDCPDVERAGEDDGAEDDDPVCEVDDCETGQPAGRGSHCGGGGLGRIQAETEEVVFKCVVSRACLLPPLCISPDLVGWERKAGHPCWERKAGHPCWERKAGYPC